ncbi:MAG: hypothetical protein IJX65_02590 [Alistipes sp.]|nr:hypothetical protein [Alistipes sp.]
MRWLLSIVALALSFTATAQSTRERIIENPTLARGTYSLYPVPIDVQSPAPRGYKAFYISHYGRHGSRFIQTNEQFDTVVAQLSDAASKGALTPLGESVYAQFMAASGTCARRAGELTAVGVAQQRGIAERMYAAHPALFGRGAKVTATSTVVPRVILSMTAFTQQLVRMNPKLEIQTETGRRYMGYINPYSPDNDPELSRRVACYRFPEAEWSKRWYDFRDANIDNSRLLSSLFKEEYIASIAAPMEFVMNLFRNAICFAGTGTGVDIEEIFTPEERYRWWRVINLFYYVEKGNSGIGGGFISDVSDILLKNFVDEADRYIARGERGATLRFGHDGNVIGLLNSMGVTGWAERVESFEAVEDRACDFTVPMAANVQWVFYSNKRGEIIVKMLLNEQPITFPIQSDIAPYYRWQDVRSYCIGRLRESVVYNYRDLK